MTPRRLTPLCRVDGKRRALAVAVSGRPDQFGVNQSRRSNVGARPENVGAAMSEQTRSDQIRPDRTESGQPGRRDTVPDLGNHQVSDLQSTWTRERPAELQGEDPAIVIVREWLEGGVTATFCCHMVRRSRHMRLSGDHWSSSTALSTGSSSDLQAVSSFISCWCPGRSLRSFWS